MSKTEIMELHNESSVLNSFELITKNINLNNIIGKSHLINKLQKNEQINGYWGTAPTGRIHIGYIAPLMKIADFVEAGCHIYILLADVHAFLDSRKSDLEDQSKVIYYRELITASLNLLNVDMSKVHFVVGSSYQYNPEYIRDLLKFLDVVTDTQAKHAGAEVVKQSKETKLSGLVYPLMQSLDEEHLSRQFGVKLDFELGGNDQRKIFTFSVDHLNKLFTDRKFTYIMNDMIPGLRNKVLEKKEESDENSVQQSHKMSSSESAGKIDLLFSQQEIFKVVNNAYCLEGDIMDNTILDLCKHIVFPMLHKLKKQFVIFRKEKYGGDFTINNFDELSLWFSEKKLHPQDLKISVSKLIADLFEPLRNHFDSIEMKQLLNKAYGSTLTNNENVTSTTSSTILVKSKKQQKREEGKKGENQKLIDHTKNTDLN